MTSWTPGPQPFAPAGTAQPTADPSSFRGWLTARTDAELAVLLRLRPDLALPAPADINTLAGRAVVRTSVQRAIDRLDAFALRVLGEIVAGAEHGGTTPTELAGRLGVAEVAVVARCAGELQALALVREHSGSPKLTPVGPVADALAMPRTALGRPVRLGLAGLTDAQLAPVLHTLGLASQPQPGAADAVAAVVADPARLQPLLAGAPAAALALVERLGQSGLGTTAPAALRTQRDASGHASYVGDEPLAWLLNHGLVIPVDERTVELPREVALAAQPGQPGTVGPWPPPIALLDRAVDLDAVGATAVLEFLRWLDSLAQEWSATPPSVLRSGGLGVRELRRSAKQLGVSESDAALLIEVAAFAGLVGPDNGPDPAFLPTSGYDEWTARDPASRWAALAQAWLAMTRQPDLVGRRDERDRVVTALGFDAERGTAPAVRAQALAVLAALPAGAAARDDGEVLARLAWTAPRRAGAARVAAAAALREAAVLGLTAAGGLTSYGRAALAAAADPDAARGWESVADALAAALPEPVDTLLVQPDLTVVVPGQPVPALAHELALLGELESSGGAAVYRISEASLRRAFDAGRSGADLLGLLSARSSTPVPQALRYLIDDLGRRYGALRAGAATSYLRCDDEDLLTRVLTDRRNDPLQLRRLAATVAVSSASPARLLATLRAAGFPPAAESPTGSVLAIGAEAPRAPARRGVRPARSQRLTDDQILAAVARMRSGEALSLLRRHHAATVPEIPGVTSAAMLATIRDAIRNGNPLWLGYVDDTGTASARTIVPISMAGGHVRGKSADGDALESFLLHRIIAARPLVEDVG